MAIVQVKGLTAGAGNVLLARAVSQHVDGAAAMGAALLVGFICYGLSIVFDVYALRYLGAAREAAIFATAPFIGAARAIPILGDRVSRSLVAAALLMSVGLALFRFTSLNASSETVQGTRRSDFDRIREAKISAHV